MLSKIYINIFYLILVFASFILYGHFLGDDIGPDLQNYQFYLGYLGLNQERLSTDILAGDINSYFNPYYYTFYYYLKTTFSSMVVNEVIGIDRNWSDSNIGKGNWTIGTDAKIVLNFDLPKKIKLVIEAFPFNKNSEESYTIQVGEDIRRFNFKDTESQNHRIEFTFSDVHDNLNEIIFNIPNPTSPASISTSKDHRELGLFIKNIYINEIKYN